MTSKCPIKLDKRTPKHFCGAVIIRELLSSRSETEAIHKNNADSASAESMDCHATASAVSRNDRT
ncbi:hypothetical protein [Helicobacter sp.]|uniref:hypothetical protein n=1 Tax=Helicobacter sp. TaxID=218 RepID=UPI00388F2DE2